MISAKTPVSIFWFRRDLRLHDNAGLYHALKGEAPVLPIFIFDKEILGKLIEPADRRVDFIHRELEAMRSDLHRQHSDLEVHYGTVHQVWTELVSKHEIKAVYTNHDYEPDAMARDESVRQLLAKHNIPFYTYKDQCIFEKLEVAKDDGTPYTVYTPYAKKWKAKLNDFHLRSYPTEKYHHNFVKVARPGAMPTLAHMGFEKTKDEFPSRRIDTGLVKHYDKTRDFPAVKGTSHLGMHFRFGTISIREKARKAKQLNSVFLGELIWRDFFMMLLANFPHVVEHSFRKEYDRIQWINDEEQFLRWCEGRTGYPMVDAGMRELNETGFMHNRVRMITASFLTKHLLIDWRWGEAYFHARLLDYELSSNNGNWQWAAGCGADAAPYFRVFNPELQMKRFDKHQEYIKKWVPGFGTADYPEPIVNHEEARKRCLAAYKKALGR